MITYDIVWEKGFKVTKKVDNVTYIHPFLWIKHYFFWKKCIITPLYRHLRLQMVKHFIKYNLTLFVETLIKFKIGHLKKRIH